MCVQAKLLLLVSGRSVLSCSRSPQRRTNKGTETKQAEEARSAEREEARGYGGGNKDEEEEEEEETKARMELRAETQPDENRFWLESDAFAPHKARPSETWQHQHLVANSTQKQSRSVQPDV